MKLSFPVDKGQYVSDSTFLSNSICGNLYPSNPMAEGSTSRGGLFAFPGSTPVWEHGIDDIVGVHGFDFSGTNLIVLEGYDTQDSLLYSLASGTPTYIGTFGASRGVPSFAHNGVTACFVFPESNKSFFYDTSSGLVQITDSVFQDYEAQAGGIRSVDEIDGYFIFNTYETFFKGSLVSTNGGKDFDALDFVKPFLKEKCICVKTIKGEVYVFGETQSKPYANVGGADFPFQEIQGGTIEKGTISHQSVVAFDNSFYFIGSGVNETKGVWRGIGGGAVTKVSTDYIDTQLAETGGDALSLQAFSINGRSFVSAVAKSVVYFSVLGVTIPFVVATGGAYDILSSQIKDIPVWVDVDYLFYDSIFEFGDTLYSTSYTGVYSVDTSKSLGSVEFSSQYLQAQSDPMIVNRLELVMEVGIGRNPNQAIEEIDPQVSLSVSDDGGNTWSSLGSQSIGKNGKYNTRLVWPMLGISPVSRMFKFNSTTELPVRFHRIDMEVEKGFLYG